MLDLHVKTFTPKLSFKAGAPAGSISVEFATMNVVDSDGDITLPGAFGKQDVRIQPAQHDTADFAIGKGVITEAGDKAVLDGILNLDMTRGKDAYASLKFDLENGAPLQEWSYIYRVVDSSFGEQDGQQVRFLKSLKVYSVDPVFIGAGVGTRTMAVKAAKPYGEFLEEIDGLIEELVARTKSRIEFREKEGRTLSQSNVDHIRRMMALMMTAHEGLGQMLDSMGAPPKADDDLLEQLMRERLVYERNRAVYIN